MSFRNFLRILFGLENSSYKNCEKITFFQGKLQKIKKNSFILESIPGLIISTMRIGMMVIWFGFLIQLDIFKSFIRD